MKLRLSAWTIEHFAVDFCCFIVLYRGIAGNFGAASAETGVLFLLYDLIAFGGQIITGALSDTGKISPAAMGLTGAAAAAFAAVMLQVFNGPAGAAASMIIAAAGNALFHVGGGVYVLKAFPRRMTPGGIFVSSGAMGVALGTVVGKAMESPEPVNELPLAACLVIMLLAGRTIMGRRKETAAGKAVSCVTVTAALGEETPGNDVLREPNRGFGIVKNKKIGPAAAAIMLFAAVAVRACAGGIFPMSWDRTGWRAVLPATAAMLGKAMGGIVGDRIGALKTAVMSLTLSILLIFTGPDSVSGTLCWTLLFNMMMPLTLCAMAELMPEHAGTAFGLTTLALLVGTVLTVTVSLPLKAAHAAIVIMTFAAAIMFWEVSKCKPSKAIGTD